MLMIEYDKNLRLFYTQNNLYESCFAWNRLWDLLMEIMTLITVYKYDIGLILLSSGHLSLMGKKSRMIKY